MKKIISILIMSLMLLMIGCSSDSPTSGGTDTSNEDTKIEIVDIAVSIPPQASMVEAIGGEYVDVVTMIPPGYSPANYAPTQKEMAMLEESDIYFGIDVPTEIVNIIPVVEGNGSNIKIVDLAERVDAIYPARYFGEDHEKHGEHANEDHEEHVEHADEDHEEHGEHADEEHEAHEDHEHEEHTDENHEEHADEEHEGHNHEGRDPHIWLSYSRIEVMVNEIEKELSLLLPEQETLFKENSKIYLDELKAVDSANRKLFETVEHKEFLIYHPSLGYFAEEYGLEMIALESEGKSATVAGMTQTIEFAKEHHLKVVFYQEEFDSKQAKLLAGEISGEAVQLSPLNKDLVESLSEMGKSIRNSME